MHEQAKVVVIGPTYRQVADIVFREARIAYQQAQLPMGGKMYDTPRYEVDGERFAIGFSTDRPYNIQGFHSPHLLAIITEAHGVEQSHVDAITRLNPERVLLTGNALSLGGEFYESHHGLRDIYNPISISAFDTPNLIAGRVVVPGMVTLEDEAYQAEVFGTDSPMYLASILGEFPDDLEDALVTLRDVLAARDRSFLPDGDSVIGVDVARFGDDATVIYKRKGYKNAQHTARKVWRAHGQSLMATTGKVVEILDDDPTIDVVVIDDIGIGGGVTDRLKELQAQGRIKKNVRIVPFIGGGKAKDEKRYFNRVAEAWWEMRKAFTDGIIDIDDDRQLIAQITTRHYTLQSDRTIRLESKDDMKKRGGKSPDEGDALAMTFAPIAVQQVRPTEMHQTVYARQSRNPLGLDHSDPKYRDRDA